MKIRNQSVFDSSGLSTIVTVIKISRGPHAHHSPQIPPGEATLEKTIIMLTKHSKYMIHHKSNPKTSMQTPPQFKNKDRTVAIVPMDTMLKVV